MQLRHRTHGSKIGTMQFARTSTATLGSGTSRRLLL